MKYVADWFKAGRRHTTGQNVGLICIIDLPTAAPVKTVLSGKVSRARDFVTI
jgi:hypothetical protein